MKRFYTTLLALTLGNTAMASDIEEPSWTLVDTVEKVELREYAPSIQAVTQLDHSGQTSAGFQRLAGFIFGGNETGEAISMTAPVINDERMSFILPEGMTEDSTPAPSGQDIDFRSVPPRTLAVLKFGWFSGTERVDSMIEQLETVLNENEIPYSGKAILMRYNDPMTPPFMRRNEVAFELLGDSEI